MIRNTLLALLLLAANALGAGTAFNAANWTGYDEVDLPAPSSAVTDFPLYIDLSELSTTGGFGSEVQSDGGDIRVTKSDGTELPFDLIDWAYNAGSPTGTLRVKWSGSLSGTETLRVWAGYTGGTAVIYDTNETYGAFNAYTSDVLASLPLSGDANDRTLNADNGTLSGATISGGAANFDGSADRITFGAAEPLEAEATCTVAMRVNATNVTTDRGLLYVDTHATGSALAVWADNAATDHFAVVITTGSGGGSVYYSGATVNPATEYHLVVTYDGTTARLYIDGVEDTTGDFPLALTGALIANSQAGYALGNQVSAAGKDHLGTIRDFVMSNAAKSAAWVAYENGQLTSNATHYTYGGWTESSPFTPSGDIAFNKALLKSTFELANSRRMTALLCFDSNTRYDPDGGAYEATGYGYLHGLQKALNAKQGVWCVGPIPGSPANVTTYHHFAVGLDGRGNWGSANTGATPYTPAADFQVPEASYNPTTSQGVPRDHLFNSSDAIIFNAGGANVTTRGWHLESNFLLGFDSDLVWHQQEGRFASGAAGTRYSRNARNDTEVLAYEDVASVTGSDELVESTLTIPAHTFDGDVHLTYGRLQGTEASGNQNMNGPIYAGWGLIEKPSQTTGWLVSWFYHLGGGAAYTAAAQLTDPDATFSEDIDAAHAEYLRQAVRLQTGAKKLVLVIAYGGNDLNNDLWYDTTPPDSLGPSPTASNTVAGVVDNLRAIETKVRDLWVTDLGYNDSDLVCVFVCYQPWSATDFSDLADAIEEEFSGDSYNCGVFLNRAHTRARLLALDYGQSASSTVHLNQTGYNALSAILVEVATQNYTRLRNYRTRGRR